LISYIRYEPTRLRARSRAVLQVVEAQDNAKRSSVAT
jgi:hypothetical protein